MATGSSMRAATKAGNNSEKKTLQSHLKNEYGGAMVKDQDQPTSLPFQCEKELSLMLTIKVKCLFSYRFDIRGNTKTKISLFKIPSFHLKAVT